MSGEYRLNRPKLLIALVLAALMLMPTALYSLFLRPDLMKTPVDRLIQNISAQIAKDPKNATLQLNLARTHGMAYAKKMDELEVEKRKPNEPWFGYLPPRIPYGEIVELNEAFGKLNKLDPDGIQKMKSEANEHLKQAVNCYKKALEIDPANSTAELGLAWALDQSGSEEEAIEIYRKLIQEGWEKEKDLTNAGLAFHSLAAEAAGCLLEKLDEDEDKAEIADLEAKIEKVSQILRPITPIAIPLSAPGYDSVYDASAQVEFDADGSGRPQAWTWIRPQAGWLVYDHHRRGKITSALQFFGSVTFWCFWDNGYQALSALDDDQDGWLRGEELHALAIWQDANQNGISEFGEVRSLVAFDISAIDCACERTSIDGSIIYCNPRGCLRRDGSTLPTYDVILHRAESPVTNRLFSSAADR